MRFEYLATKQYLDAIDIEDIGNVCLNALNDFGDEYFLSIQTRLGWTEVKEFGPCTVDSNISSNYFNLLYIKYEYNENKIIKTIEKFINNDKRNITQIFFIDRKALLDRLKNVNYPDLRLTPQRSELVKALIDQPKFLEN